MDSEIKNVECPNCGGKFTLHYDTQEYEMIDGYEKPATTLNISYCLSAGVYSVDIECPWCDYEETI